MVCHRAGHCNRQVSRQVTTIPIPKLHVLKGFGVVWALVELCSHNEAAYRFITPGSTPTAEIGAGRVLPLPCLAEERRTLPAGDLVKRVWVAVYKTDCIDGELHP